MLLQYFSVGFLMLVSLMLPGPDFALVTRNTILYSRRAGLATTMGIMAAVIVHMTYCLLGLAVVIANSLLLFTIIKLVGAAYLIYIGFSAIVSKKKADKANFASAGSHKGIHHFVAFRQGFFCNLLNPKATLFFLALFTVIIKPGSSMLMQVGFAIEMLILTACWFGMLSIVLSHQRVLQHFNKVRHRFEYVLGFLLIGFGVALAFVQR